jgi:hypothetical protein
MTTGIPLVSNSIVSKYLYLTINEKSVFYTKLFVLSTHMNSDILNLASIPAVTELTKLHEIKHKSNHHSDQTVILEPKQFR